MKSLTRSVRPSLWGRSILFASIVAVGFLAPLSGQEKKESPAHLRNLAGQQEAGAVEVKFVDGSTVRLVIKDKTVDMSSPYGKLQIPVQEIERIDFATRVSVETTKKIETAVTNLADAKYPVRQQASADLLKLAEKAYPALVRAAENKDPEVARRAQDVIEIIRELLPEESFETRNNDVIYTRHSKLAGMIDLAAFKAETAPFGEVQMKIADVRSLRALGAPEESEANGAKVASADPGNLLQHVNQIGKVFRFQVTGGIVGGGQRLMNVGGNVVMMGGMGGGLWGTDTYTADSSLALAAVHAGILKQGQTGIVRVKILTSPASFEGSTRNGVTSSAFGQFQGAFKVMR